VDQNFSSVFGWLIDEISMGKRSVILTAFLVLSEIWFTVTANTNRLDYLKFFVLTAFEV